MECKNFKSIVQAEGENAYPNYSLVDTFKTKMQVEGKDAIAKLMTKVGVICNAVWLSFLLLDRESR